MECSHCSAQISSAAHFCPACGFPVDQPSSALDQKSAAKISSANSKKLPLRKLAIFLGTVVFVLALLAYFFLTPRLNALSSLKTSKALVAETSQKTGKLNQSLEAMYNYVTASSQGTTESSVSNQAVSFISENTTTVYPVPSLYFLKEPVIEAVEGLKKSQVKGFSTPKDDPLKAYRDLRDLSVNAQNTAKDGLESISKLTAFKEKGSSAHLTKVSSDLEIVTRESQNYLAEGEKTAVYYQTYTDAYVDLSGLIVGSLQATNLKQIETNLEEAKKIHTEMDSISSSKLPNEIADFHEDILTEIQGALEFLTTFSKAAATNDPKSINQATEAAQKWVAEEKALLLKIQTDQINFWKKNIAFSNYDFLENSQNELVNNLDEEVKANSFLFIK
jgi:hypothetical protein